MLHSHAGRSEAVCVRPQVKGSSETKRFCAQLCAWLNLPNTTSDSQTCAYAKPPDAPALEQAAAAACPFDTPAAT